MTELRVKINLYTTQRWSNQLEHFYGALAVCGHYDVTIVRSLSESDGADKLLASRGGFLMIIDPLLFLEERLVDGELVVEQLVVEALVVHVQVVVLAPTRYELGGGVHAHEVLVVGVTGEGADRVAVVHAPHF